MRIKDMLNSGLASSQKAQEKRQQEEEIKAREEEEKQAKLYKEHSLLLSAMQRASFVKEFCETPNEYDYSVDKPFSTYGLTKYIRHELFRYEWEDDYGNIHDVDSLIGSFLQDVCLHSGISKSRLVALMFLHKIITISSDDKEEEVDQKIADIAIKIGREAA